MRPAAAVVLCAALACLPAVRAQAQDASTRSRGAPRLGTVIQGRTATTFSLSPQGVVTRRSGDAIRLSRDTVMMPTFSVDCGLGAAPGRCAGHYYRITIRAAGTGGPASVSRIRVAGLSGARYRLDAPPVEGASVTFDLEMLPSAQTALITVGMDVVLAGDAPSGVYDFDYAIEIEAAP